MSRSELQAQVDSITDEVERYLLENKVLQRFVEKKTIELGADEDDKRKKKSKPKQSALLTSEMKHEISLVIFEDMKIEIENHRKNAEKTIDTLRAVLEETEIRINDLKRDAYEFKRDIVVGAENPRTGKIMAERVSRYFEDKSKQLDAVIEKLRLKNAALKGQQSKVEALLAQKEEVGDVLHYIDFHQLQIENKQYVAKIEERNEELLNLKVTTGKTIQSLNDYKKKLQDKMEEADWLKSEIKEKKANLDRLQRENGRVNKDVKTEQRASDRLRIQIEAATEMPNVDDYIMQKKEMYECESTLANWQKKVEIMEMAAKKARINMTRSKLGVSGNKK